MNKSSLNKKSIIRAASPRDVTYYFKEQKSHLNCKGEWTDDIFPPNKNSLLGLDKNGKFIDPDCEADTDTIEMEIQPDNVIWKRAKDIPELGPDAQLFVDGIDANDVQQGGLGTCYFLSAIAAITEFPSIIKDLLFKTKNTSENGVYEIVMFIDGDWMIVPVDDYFPVEADTGSLKFTRANGKELWVILLEKAWAKVNGGYLNISGGNTVHSLFTLTGFPCTRVVHEREARHPNKLWESILESEQRDDIMCASTYGITDDDEGNKREQEYDELGLSPGHAYTLVGAKQAQYNGQTLRLVLLRNPHGVFSGINTEWTGPWSDNDERWNAELNELFHHSNKEDGCFWMDFYDFFHHYEDTFFCDILYDGKLNYFKYKDTDTMKVPNVISFHIEKDTKMIVSVFRDTWRFVRQVKGHRYPFTLVMAQYDPKTKKISDVDGKFFYDDYHEHPKTFKAGHHIVWVYYDIESCTGPILSEYVVRLASIDEFRTKEVGTDPEFKLLTEICLAGMRENYDESELAKPTVLKMDGDLKGTFIGCFYMQNNMTNSMLNVKGNLKSVHSYKVLGKFNKQPSYSVDLNPGDCDIIIGIRKPPKKGRGKKPEFEITRTMTNLPATGKGGKQSFHDTSKWLTDISKTKIEYSQIVNINKDQFKETKAQNKAEKALNKFVDNAKLNPTPVTTTTTRTEQPRVEERREVRVEPTVTRSEPRYEEKREVRVEPTVTRSEPRYEERREVRTEPTVTRSEPRYEERREVRVEPTVTRSEPRYEERREVRAEPTVTRTYAEPTTVTRSEPRYEERREVRTEPTVTSSTRYGNYDTNSDNKYVSSTGNRVVYDDNNYGGSRVVSSTGTTSSKAYDGDLYANTRYANGVGTTTTNRVVYDDNYGVNKVVTSGSVNKVVYDESYGSKISAGGNVSKVVYDGDSKVVTSGTVNKVAYDGDSYGSNRYVSGTTGTTTSNRVVYDGDSYGGSKVVTSGTTSKVTYDGDSSGGKYVTTTSGNRVLYDGDSKTGTTSKVVSYGGNTGSYTTSSTYGDSASKIISNVSKQYNDDEYEVVGVKQATGTVSSGYGGYSGSSGSTGYRTTYQN
jgi:hypothetical protein